MKTAIDFLIDQLGEYFPDYIGGIELLVKQSKQMEKEQICNAYIDGLEGLWISAEEYYNKEYNQNK
jgi:hypothetical protein